MSRPDLKVARDAFAVAASDLLYALDEHLAASDVPLTAAPVIPQVDTSAGDKAASITAERQREAAAGKAALAANAAAKASHKK